jgi:hypothetical protein
MKPNMNGFKGNIVILLCLITISFACSNRNDRSKNRVMEISDAIKNEKSISSFVERYFEPVTPFYKNPLFPLKINHKSKGRTITFCNIVPIDSWALKLDDR